MRNLMNCQTILEKQSDQKTKSPALLILYNCGIPTIEILHHMTDKCPFVLTMFQY